jgi:hypothetical protein
MSFVDTVKYVRQLQVVDEFGGRGDVNNISQFYIIFRATDDSGNEIHVSKEDVEAALKEDVPDIILTDYIGKTEWKIATLGEDNLHFELDGVDFRNNVNIITIKIRDSFKEDTTICVRFQQDVKDDAGSTKKVELVSSCYLSDFPSCFFLNKTTA